MAATFGAPEELETLNTADLIAFLESSFQRSDFIKVADILRARENSAIYELQNKVTLLEKELDKERHKCASLTKIYEKTQIANDDFRVLQESERKAQEKIKGLTELLQFREKSSNVELDLCRNKCSMLESWILLFLEKHSRLVEEGSPDRSSEKKSSIVSCFDSFGSDCGCWKMKL